MNSGGSLFELSFAFWGTIAVAWFAGVAASIYLVVRLESRKP